jgi:N-acetylglucosaminyldiphosphoundecaprenol N-acetyl-beta-D-mannosaminyltransferase
VTVGKRFRSVDILGVRVDDVTLAEALDLAAGWLRQDRPRLVVTPNAEFVMRAQRDLAFRKVLNSADLAIPDGFGVVWASRVLGNPLREQVPGTDFAEGLVRLAGDRYRVFFLGAGPGVAEAAARRLAARYPGLRVAGAYPGSPHPAADAEVLAVLSRARPIDILLVAYGAPKQEFWLARNLARVGAKVGVGVGGAFDFFSGRVPRAPAWVRRAGFDWAFRLAVQPWRWRRQLALPAFALQVLWHRLTGHRAPDRPFPGED